MVDKVTFLGVVSGSPTASRNVSSYVFHVGQGVQWMIDCGEGTQHRVLQCSEVGPSRITTIFITHMHGDHCFGLPGLLCSFSLSGTRTQPLLIVGPAGIKEFLTTSLQKSYSYLSYPLEICELEPMTVVDLGLIDGIKASAYPIRHNDVPSFGFIFEETEKANKIDPQKAKAAGVQGPLVGKLLKEGSVSIENKTIFLADVVMPPIPGRKIVALGDTSDPSSVLAHGMGCTLLIHECTLDAKREDLAVERGHSTSAMAGRFAAQLQAKTLLLTHFSPRFFAKDSEITFGDLAQEALLECQSTTQVLIAEELKTFVIDKP